MTIYSKQGQDLTFTAIRHARFGASCKTELIYCQTKSFSTIATLPTFTNLLHLPPFLFLTHHHHHHHHCNTLLPAHSNIKRYGTIISQDILTNTYPSKYAFTKSNLICPPPPIVPKNGFSKQSTPLFHSTPLPAQRARSTTSSYTPPSLRSPDTYTPSATKPEQRSLPSTQDRAR